MASELPIFGKFSVTQQKVNEQFSNDYKLTPTQTLIIRGNVLENITDPEILKQRLGKLGKVDEVRLVRKYADDKSSSMPMRDFAFVDFASVTEAKKVFDFFSKHGLLIEGSEVSVNYCRSGHRPFNHDSY